MFRKACLFIFMVSVTLTVFAQSAPTLLNCHTLRFYTFEVDNLNGSLASTEPLIAFHSPAQAFKPALVSQKINIERTGDSSHVLKNTFGASIVGQFSKLASDKVEARWNSVLSFYSFYQSSPTNLEKFMNHASFVFDMSKINISKPVLKDKRFVHDDSHPRKSPDSRSVKPLMVQRVYDLELKKPITSDSQLAADEMRWAITTLGDQHDIGVSALHQFVNGFANESTNSLIRPIWREKSDLNEDYRNDLAESADQLILALLWLEKQRKTEDVLDLVVNKVRENIARLPQNVKIADVRRVGKQLKLLSELTLEIPGFRKAPVRLEINLDFNDDSCSLMSSMKGVLKGITGDNDNFSYEAETYVVVYR
ncbi:MAG: hypothetical protein KIT45_05810 [Fimbriimonadia bacterium]|nr:hypothetical protein [Fimbriimonadia bacterium]